ncbi:glycosyltransferase family 1 protein [Candidatus Methylospira mobilis]|uniref:glycosyltransferase family 4 protein n=1 Tax=Candidatus Methylospira mobilis TaxID=1808979 RepID=UPI0028EE92CC|nr:glycosyltransferase family 1 protein [Candidatus Methylospira mobilis]WNV06084.1 glycosyltransferase family 1 protein [Candidatus Methylospira mobilis]
MNKRLNTIAVDLTPVLPGGENGGAKIFVLELLRHLAEMAPQTRFILLTQAAAHEELEILDRSNVRRLMVVGPAAEPVAPNQLGKRFKSFARRLLSIFPGRVRRVVNRLRYKLSTIPSPAGFNSMLREMNVDLLFCPFTAPTYFEPGIPVVSTIYDLQYKTYPDFFAEADVAQRDRTFNDACRRATVLVAISDYARESALKHGNLDPFRISTVYLRMGQRIAQQGGDDGDILSRHALGAKKYLLYPANFWKHKNHEMLITAFGMACAQGLAADIKLVCTGAPGERQEWLKRSVRAMHLHDRVIFPGYLPNAELGALISSCLGVVFPSLYEGFGLPVIEAMAAGVPVACSNTTSLPEVASEAAILFNPRIPDEIAQAMVTLAENEVLRERLVRAGLQRAAEFADSALMTRQYWECFQFALTNAKHGNQLIGVYEDGWCSPALNIQIAAAAGARTLEIEFLAPKWLPETRLTVQGYRNDTPLGSPLIIARGAGAQLSLPVESGGGWYKVTISPPYIPSYEAHGDDQRVLSCIMQRCGIALADGERTVLFSGKTDV